MSGEWKVHCYECWIVEGWQKVKLVEQWKPVRYICHTENFTKHKNRLHFSGKWQFADHTANWTHGETQGNLWGDSTTSTFEEQLLITFTFHSDCISFCKLTLTSLAFLISYFQFCPKNLECTGYIVFFVVFFFLVFMLMCPKVCKGGHVMLQETRDTPTNCKHMIS